MNTWIVYNLYLQLVVDRFCVCVFQTMPSFTPKGGANHTMLNNEYQRCVVVQHSDQHLGFAQKLVGTRTEGGLMAQIKTIS